MLDWLKIEEPNYYDEIQVFDQEEKNVGPFTGIQFDYVIGSDLLW